MRKRKEKKIWADRVRSQVRQLTADRTRFVEVPIAGLPSERRSLLDSYVDQMRGSGYRLKHVVKEADIWKACFELRSTASRS